MYRVVYTSYMDMDMWVVLNIWLICFLSLNTLSLLSLREGTHERFTSA